MSKDKLKEYVVIKPGVCIKGTEQCEVGDKIKITEAKALLLVGKVVSASKHADDSKSTKDLKAELAKALKANEQLTEQNEQLTEQLTKLTEQLTPAPKTK